MTKKRPDSREFLYVVDDQRQDAAAHFEILNNDAPPVVARDVASSCGLTEREIASLYGEQS